MSANVMQNFYRAERCAYLRFALECRRFRNNLRRAGFTPAECWPTEFLYGRQRANARRMRTLERGAR